VDAFSGALLQHYGKYFLILGLKEYDFYTVVFGVSRAIGCLSNGIWARIYGLPIERPNSIDLNYIERLK
jgi:citrate synthase